MEEEINKQKNEVDPNEEMPQEFLDYFNSQPEDCIADNEETNSPLPPLDDEDYEIEDESIYGQKIFSANKYVWLEKNDFIEIPEDELVFLCYACGNNNKDKEFIAEINQSPASKINEIDRTQMFINKLCKEIKIYKDNTFPQYYTFFNKYSFYFINHEKYTNNIITHYNKALDEIHATEGQIDNTKTNGKKYIIYKNFIFNEENCNLRKNYAYFTIYILKKEEDKTISGISDASIEKISKIITSTNTELSNNNKMIKNNIYSFDDYDLILGSKGMAILIKDQQANLSVFKKEWYDLIQIYLLAKFYDIKHNFYSTIIKSEYQKDYLSITDKSYQSKEIIKKIFTPVLHNFPNVYNKAIRNYSSKSIKGKCFIIYRNIINCYKYKMYLIKNGRKLNKEIKKIQQSIYIYNYFQYINSPIIDTSSNDYNIWGFLSNYLRLKETNEEVQQQGLCFLKFMENHYQEKINKKIIWITYMASIITIISILGNIDSIIRNIKTFLCFLFGE